MRACHCTGHLTNPGGVCCMDLPSVGTITTTNTLPLGKTRREPLTEEQVRQIIREEIKRSGA